MEKEILFLQICVAVLGLMFVALAIMFDMFRKRIQGDIHFFLHMTVGLLEKLVKSMPTEPEEEKPMAEEKEKDLKLCDACNAQIMRDERFNHYHNTDVDYCEKCIKGGKIIKVKI